MNSPNQNASAEIKNPFLEQLGVHSEPGSEIPSDLSTLPLLPDLEKGQNLTKYLLQTPSDPSQLKEDIKKFSKQVISQKNLSDPRSQTLKNSAKILSQNFSLITEDLSQDPRKTSCTFRITRKFHNGEDETLSMEFKKRAKELVPTKLAYQDSKDKTQGLGLPQGPRNKRTLPRTPGISDLRQENISPNANPQFAGLNLAGNQPSEIQISEGTSSVDFSLSNYCGSYGNPADSEESKNSGQPLSAQEQTDQVTEKFSRVDLSSEEPQIPSSEQSSQLAQEASEQVIRLDMVSGKPNPSLPRRCADITSGSDTPAFASQTEAAQDSENFTFKNSRPKEVFDYTQKS